MSKALQNMFLFIFFCVSIFLIIFVYTRGILFYDEGWVIHPAQRVLQGDVPYRNFHYIYTPGSLYITALSFIMFGKSILATRIMAFIFTIISILTIFQISKILKFNLISLLVAILMFIVWLPLHINFSWPVVYSTGFYLLSLYSLLIFYKNKANSYLFLAAVCGFLTFFFKQNFGAAAFLSSLIIIFITDNKDRFRSLGYYLVGFLVPSLIWLGYLVLSKSFIPFLNDTYYLLWLGRGVQSTPFIYLAPILSEIAKTSLYLMPLLISLSALYLLKNNNRILFAIPIFTGLFYLFGIRPTTDFTHYIPLIAISGLSLGVILTKITQKRLKIFIGFLSFILIVLGLYTAFFRGYYTWNPTILNYDKTINNNRIGIYVDSKSKYDITYLENLVNSTTNKSDYVFIEKFSPLLYFILDRKNPTPYEFISPYLSSKNAQQEIIEALKDKKVKLIISDFSVENSNYLLSLYIRNNYQEKNFKDFEIWVKK